MGALHQAVIGSLGGASAPPPLLLADGTFATSTGWLLPAGATVAGGVLTVNAVGGVQYVRAPTNCAPSTSYVISYNKSTGKSGASLFKIGLAADADAISGVTVDHGAATGALGPTIAAGAWTPGGIHLLIIVSASAGDFDYVMDNITIEAAS